MTTSIRSMLILGGLVLASIAVTLYTLSAYDAARYAFDNGGPVLIWRYSPSGSFLPWPRRPGMLFALSEGNAVDLFIYRYLINSWILVALAVLLWVATILHLISISKIRLRASTKK